MDERLPSHPSSSSPSSSSSSPEGAQREETHPQTNSESRSRTNTTFFGRHRMTAAITKVQNEINIIQEELNELDTLGGSSIPCKELIPSVLSIPDPLLPATRGPADPNWDQWFRGAHGTRGHKRWI